MMKAVLEALIVLGVLLLVGAKAWVAIGAAVLMIAARLVQQQRSQNP